MQEFSVGDKVRYIGGTPELQGVEGILTYRGGVYAKIEVTKGNSDYKAGLHAYPDWENLEHIPAGGTPIEEAVVHPAHYGGDTTYEAIKVIEAWELGFHLGNTVKYISRAGKKDKAKLLEDLKKALWYLQRKIARLEEELATSE